MNDKIEWINYKMNECLLYRWIIYIHLRLSVWVLYSIEALAGRYNTRLNVSLILAVVAASDAVLFHTHIISSWKSVFFFFIDFIFSHRTQNQNLANFNGKMSILLLLAINSNRGFIHSNFEWFNAIFDYFREDDNQLSMIFIISCVFLDDF